MHRDAKVLVVQMLLSFSGNDIFMKTCAGEFVVFV